MSEPIRVGDLVRVALPSVCTGGNDMLGYIFVVLNIKFGEHIPGGCSYCGKNHGNKLIYAEAPDGWYPLRRLRRIPPLSELEESERKEKVKV